MTDQTKSLTKRQSEFLAMSARGLTYQQIAEECFVAIGTVRGTFEKARLRIGASTNVQAVVLAISREELGLTHDGQVFVPSAPNSL